MFPAEQPLSGLVPDTNQLEAHRPPCSSSPALRLVFTISDPVVQPEASVGTLSPVRAPFPLQAGSHPHLGSQTAHQLIHHSTHVSFLVSLITPNYWLIFSSETFPHFFPFPSFSHLLPFPFAKPKITPEVDETGVVEFLGL